MLVLALPIDPSRAHDDRADVEPNELPPPGRSWAWKATLGRYLQTADASGTDANLRASDDDDTVWIGAYRDGAGFRQLRVGWERQVRAGPVRLIGSAQVASGGFVGGSVTVEGRLDPGERLAALVGIGRTNLRPYVNLNFDPNDSTLLGLRWRVDPATDATLFQLRDDRLDTGQRVAHLVVRRRLGALDAVSVDLFHRSGRASPDAPRVVGTGVALAWSRAAWSVRLAYDPRATYGESDMTRLAIAARF